MIRWVFFDIGDTVVHEDRSHAAIYRHLEETLGELGHHVAYEELLAERERMIVEDRLYAPFLKQLRSRAGEEPVEAFMARYRADIRSRWNEVNIPIRGMIELVHEVAGWGVQTGIIADQPEQTVDLLRHLGLWDIFQIRGLSALAGHHKPQRSFYQWALAEADCEPHEAIMIGDRVDNDVEPAKSIGMHTIWFPCEAESKPDWSPMEPHEQLYRASVRRVSSSAILPEGEAQRPTATVRNAGEMRDALARIIREAAGTPKEP